jgi:hypothetical protein
MAFIEQSFGAHAKSLRSSLPVIRQWGTRTTLKLLHLPSSPILEPRPTSSGSVLFLRGLSAAGAVLYRNWGPEFVEFKTRLLAEPELIGRRAVELRSKAEQEIRLHQDILARLVKRTAQRV